MDQINIHSLLSQLFRPLNVEYAGDAAGMATYRITGRIESDNLVFTTPMGGYFSAFRKNGNDYSLLLFINQKEFTAHYENVLRG